MRLIRTALIGLSVLAGEAAIAGPVQTEQFYRTCTEAQTDNIFCLAYMEGIIAGLIYGDFTRKNGQSYCIPPSTSYAEALGISRQFIAKHPDFLSGTGNKDAAGIITLALVKAFPCQ
jgi:hypothetical protein